MRRRAKHRLIGSVLLVLAGVIGFPLLFDTQPRPVPVDVQISIPDKNKVPPLAIPDGKGGTPSALVTGKSNEATAEKPAEPAAPVKPAKPAPDAGRVSAAASLDQQEQIVPPNEPVPTKTAPPKVEAKAEPKDARPAQPKSEPAGDKKPEAKPESRPEPKADAKPAPTADKKPEAKPDHKTDKNADAERAKQLLAGKGSAPSDDGRYIIQVGAFADGTKAHEVRQQLERAGLKTYTHIAQTKDGERIRVRVGPFPNRHDADQAATKVKALSLPAVILSL